MFLIVSQLFNYLHSFEGGPATLTPDTPIPLGVGILLYLPIRLLTVSAGVPKMVRTLPLKGTQQRRWVPRQLDDTEMWMVVVYESRYADNEAMAGTLLGGSI